VLSISAEGADCAVKASVGVSAGRAASTALRVRAGEQGCPRKVVTTKVEVAAAPSVDPTTTTV